MKRFTSLLNRTKSSSSIVDTANAPSDSPEANAVRAIKLFCESPRPSTSGDEVLQLPIIVDAAESSPRAATAAAQQIRKFLSKEYSTAPHVQYNSIMLLRILCDNPGPLFMRNFDKAFVTTVKECLKNCQDFGTQQSLRETLDSLEVNKQFDEGVQPLLQMWRKEKGAGAAITSRPSVQHNPAMSGSRRGNNSAATRNQLPAPAELASRIEEAKNTAQILLQFVQTSSSDELLSNDLIREFAERCHMAQKSMQTYISSTNPHPDHDTMQTLIETNEQLSLASSRYHRAMLAARRAGDQQPTTNGTTQTQPTSPHNPIDFAAPPARSTQAFQAPSGPPPGQTKADQNKSPVSASTPSNPFADPTDPTSTSLFAPAATVQSFSIQAEPSYAPTASPAPPLHHRSDIAELAAGAQAPPLARQTVAANTTRADDNEAYAATPMRPTHSSDGYNVSPPRSPTRPGVGPYHNSGMTPSYVGRQDSALRGLTMHGAQTNRDGAA